MFKFKLVGRAELADGPDLASLSLSPYGFAYRGIPTRDVPADVLDGVIRWTLDTYGKELSRAESIEIAGWVLGFDRVTRESRELLRNAYRRVTAAA